MSEHVRAGGSKIHRILACPGSLQAPDSEAGPAAAKGTTAHHVGERCIVLGCDPDHPSFLGQSVMGVKVDRAMADAVAVYVDWARNMIQTCKDAGLEYHLFVERSVDWSALEPPEPMRGSADFILVIPALRRMIVADYKNGVDPVEAKGNAQLRYYAVGALVSLPRELTKDIREVQMTIIQPNAQPLPEEGAICSETIETMDLLDFAEDVMAAVRAGQADQAPRQAGKHCKYCSLAGGCPARAQRNVVDAQAEFDVATVEAAAPGNLAAIPIEDLAEMVLKAEEFVVRAQDWLKEAKGRIEGALLAGEEVPGWKMVPKRATRVWNDEMEVEIWASQQKLTTDDLYAPRVLKSPAQLEEVVGKKNLPKGLYASVSTGYSLARATNPKNPARLGAGDEFDTVQP